MAERLTQAVGCWIGCSGVFNPYICNIQVASKTVTVNTWTFGTAVVQSFFQYDEVAQLLFQLITQEKKKRDGQISLVGWGEGYGRSLLILVKRAEFPICNVFFPHTYGHIFLISSSFN